MTTDRTRRHSRILMFFAFYALTFIAQAGGAYFTQLGVHDWYPALHKSELTPPGMYFGIAWTILYVLMALAAERIHHQRQTWRSRSLCWWMIQLLLGLIWCIVFFGQREIGIGLVVISATWVAAAVTLYRFYRIDRMAGALMLPLQLWLSFASYLNGFIWLHN